jgi:hypothetical protein
VAGILGIARDVIQPKIMNHFANHVINFKRQHVINFKRQYHQLRVSRPNQAHSRSKPQPNHRAIHYQYSIMGICGLDRGLRMEARAMNVIIVKNGHVMLLVEN